MFNDQIQESMKYFVRSVKYFLQFTVLFAVILCILVLIGMAEADMNTILEDGWNSVWKILLMFAAVAAIYPRFAFIKRRAYIEKPWDECRDAIIEHMNERGYKIDLQEDKMLRFRLRAPFGRVAKMMEDAIIITAEEDGIHFEGLRKDVLRIVSALETILNR